jgi:ATP-dependent helicase/nuclease subunit A
MSDRDAKLVGGDAQAKGPGLNPPTSMTQPQQDAAINRAGENIALRSGAGCGKTFVLARRFTELLMHSPQENPLSRLVALTFTEKAALEMAQRARKLLGDLAAGSRDDGQRAKLRNWLQEISQARISTIHGFCSNLLRTHAVEAGIDPGFTVCQDQMLLDEMLAEAVEQAVLSAIEQPETPTDAAGLLAAVPYESIVTYVQALVQRRTDWKPADYADPSAIVANWQRLAGKCRADAMGRLCADQELQAKVSRLLAVPCRDAGDKLALAREEQLGLVASLLANPKDAPALIAQINPSLGSIGSPKAWGDAGTLKAVRTELRAVLESVAQYAIYFEELNAADEQSAHALCTLSALAGRAAAIYEASKRAQGLLDFTDLLAHAHRLLTGDSQLRNRVSERMQQLLVDEAQDVDPFQFDLLFALAGWEDRDNPPPPGKLFLVGDGKQSIYRFRGAKVEVFENACRNIGARQQIDLDISFRTHVAGVEFINHLFGKLMAGDYSPTRAKREQPPPHDSVEILIAAGTAEEPIANEQSATEAQAIATAQRISQMVWGGERLVWDQAAQQWRPAQYRDIAILFSRMTSSLEYERQLDRCHVPYYVVAGTGFYRQQEIFDVLNVMGAIDNPFDDIAFFGALRSSLFGIDDQTLMRIAAVASKPYLPWLLARESLGELGVTDQDQAGSLALAVEMLGRLNRRKDSVEIAELMQQVVSACSYEAVLLAQFQGKRMAGNVRRLIQQAREVGPSLSLAQYLRQATQQVIDESRQEQAAVAGEEEDVVRLMTIHKAKGLEFPIVVLPDLNAGRRGPASRLLSRSDWGLTLGIEHEDDSAAGEQGERAQRAQGESDGAVPLSHQLARLMEKQDQHKEDVRRLYVAATRHMDHLVFVGADWRAKGTGQFRSGGSFLAQMDDALGITQALESSAGRITYGGGRFGLAVKCVTPQATPRSERELSVGQAIVHKAASARQIASGLLGAVGANAPPAPPLLAPLPEEGARLEIAVTALGDFAQCPMLYRWRYELGVRSGAGAGASGGTGVPPASAPAGSTPTEREETHGPDAHATPGLDAAARGTLLHRCMELVDFANPQEPSLLVGQAAADVGMEGCTELPAVAQEFQQMLARFKNEPLWHALANSTNLYRELEFTVCVGPARLRGKVDLIFEDAAQPGAGAPPARWHIMDYKSDKVSKADLAEHCKRYSLQMTVYRLAMQRHLCVPTVSASLYFLRLGQSVDMTADDEETKRAVSQIEALCRDLIHRRRTGDFPKCVTPHCAFCTYHSLCEQFFPRHSIDERRKADIIP